MTKCEYCMYYNTYGCNCFSEHEDSCYPTKGCGDFEFDTYSMTDEEIGEMLDLYLFWKKAVRRQYDGR